jgi:hypothetical protein
VDLIHLEKARMRERKWVRARWTFDAFEAAHFQQMPKASRRWPLMQKAARNGEADARTGSTSAQNGSR